MAKPIVDKYLDELAHDLSDLPAPKRRELLAEIKGHIEGALSQIAQPGEADVRNVLERLGEPADIAEEARDRFGVTKKAAGGVELAAVIGLSMVVLVVLNGSLALLGWLIGLILLWWSHVWTTRDKVIGTAMVPAMLLLFRAGLPYRFTSPVIPFLAFGIALGVIVYLARKAYRARLA
jgi:uncharacterized membrane protein